MNRYNMFNQIHKALRSLLYDTALLLQQTDFMSRDDVKDVLLRIEQVIDVFDKHADTEDSLVLPALAPYEPAVVNVFEEEHDKDHELAQRLKELVFVFLHSEASETRRQTGVAINVAYTEFLIFNLNHMAKEEKVLNRLLWRYYSDEELQQLTQTILSKQSPESMAFAGKWMMRGLSNNEIIAWLKEVQKNAPPFVLQALTATAENELPVTRWKLIQENIMTEKAVA